MKMEDEIAAHFRPALKLKCETQISSECRRTDTFDGLPGENSKKATEDGWRVLRLYGLTEESCLDVVACPRCQMHIEKFFVKGRIYKI